MKNDAQNRISSTNSAANYILASYTGYSARYTKYPVKYTGYRHQRGSKKSLRTQFWASFFVSFRKFFKFILLLKENRMEKREKLEKDIGHLILALKSGVATEDIETRVMLTVLATELFKLTLKEVIPKEDDREMIGWIVFSGARSACVEEDCEDRLKCVEMLNYTLYKLLIGEDPNEIEETKQEQDQDPEIKNDNNTLLN